MDNVQRDIELTARLLRAEDETVRDDLMCAFDEVFTQLEEDYRSALMKSSMPDGEKVFQELSATLERQEIFLIFPQLLGKTLVGLVSFDDELFKRSFAPFLSETTINRLLLNSGLPCLLLDQSDDVKVLNDADTDINLNVDEYNRTNRRLYQYDLDIRKWLRAFSMRGGDRSHENLSFVWLPPMYMDLWNDFNRNLFDKLDALIIFAPPELQAKQSDRLKNFKSLVDQRSVYIVSTSANEVPQILEQLNFARMNYLFVAKMHLALFDVKKFYRTRLLDAETDMRLLNSDLLKLNTDDTREILSSLQNQTRYDKEALESERNALAQAEYYLIEKASKFETALASKASAQNQWLFPIEAINKLGLMILRAVDVGDFNLTNNYIGWLKHLGFDKTYVFELITDAAQNRSSSFDRLELLKREPDDELIRKTKLKLRRRLNFSDFDCMQIARDIKNLSTADEFYYRGRWLEHSGDINRAIKFYKKATVEGSSEASTRLLEKARSQSDTKLLEWLANQLIPEANYRLGLKAREEKKFGRSITQFKLAAARGYMPAIKALADFFRHKVFGKKFKELSESEQRDKLNNCLSLHHYILQNEPGNSEVREAIGDLYQRLGDERRAFNYWDQCSTSTANYKCGRLFQYPDGAFPQDLDRAEKYFERAAKGGHEKASTELDKVRNWKRKEERRQERQRQQQYDSRQSYTTRTESYEDHSSGGFCVITTAVCTTLGKPDDCDELMTMRAYRDAAAERNPLVATLIEEYYRLAPLLIERIDRCDDRLSEYERLWNDYIVETYRLIKAGDARAATFKYIDMVTSLCRQYDVALADGIDEKIAALK